MLMFILCDKWPSKFKYISITDGSESEMLCESGKMMKPEDPVLTLERPASSQGRRRLIDFWTLKQNFAKVLKL